MVKKPYEWSHSDEAIDIATYMETDSIGNDANDTVRFREVIYDGLEGGNIDDYENEFAPGEVWHVEAEVTLPERFQEYEVTITGDSYTPDSEEYIRRKVIRPSEFLTEKIEAVVSWPMISMSFNQDVQIRITSLEDEGGGNVHVSVQATCVKPAARIEWTTFSRGNDRLQTFDLREDFDPEYNVETIDASGEYDGDGNLQYVEFEGDLTSMENADSAIAYFEYRMIDPNYESEWSVTDSSTLFDTGRYTQEEDDITQYYDENAEYEYRAVVEDSDGENRDTGDTKTFTVAASAMY